MPVSVKSSYTTTKAVCKRVLLYTCTTVYLPHILKSSFPFILHSDGKDDIYRTSAVKCTRNQTERKKIQTDGRKYCQNRRTHTDGRK